MYILPGAGAGGVGDIKSHPFFATINWDWLYRRLIVPPFKPVVSHIDDAFHFDTEFTSRTPHGTDIGMHFVIAGVINLSRHFRSLFSAFVTSTIHVATAKVNKAVTVTLNSITIRVNIQYNADKSLYGP